MEKMALAFLLKKKGIIVWSSLVLFLISLFFTIRLFSHVRAEVEYLLPPNSKTLLDINEARSRYPQSDILLVFFDGANAEEVKRQFNYVKDRLAANPNPLVAHVMSQIKEEIDFFALHRLNYYPLQNWKELRAKIIDDNRVRETTKPEQALQSMRGLKDKINRLILVKKMQNFAGLRALPNGEFVSNDGTVRMMVIFHSKPMTNLDDAVSFDKYINNIIKEAQHNSMSEVKIHLSGIAKALVAEYRSLWSDLIQSIIITLVLVFLAVWLFFKNLKILIPLFFVLLLGTFSGFAICSIFFEQINSNSAFLCSVVIGNAVNTGIIFLSHLIHILKNNKNYEEAIVQAFEISFTPTLISAISSSIAFLCLTINSFRGYYEFGVVGSVGMVLGWLGMIYILPIFAGLKMFRLPETFIESYKVPFSAFWSSLFDFIVDRKKIIGSLLFIGFISALTIIIVHKSYRPSQFLERDMTHLKDRSYNSRKLTTLEPLLKRVFLKREFIPAMVLLTDSDIDAFKLKDAIASDPLMRIMMPELKGYTLWDVLPLNELEKMRIYSDLKKQDLDKWKIQPNITKNDEKLIDDIKKSTDYRSLKRDELPFYLQYFFTESNGNVGKVVHLNFNLNNLETDLFKIFAVMDRIKLIAKSTVGENHYVISGLIPMLAEMGNMILKDTWKSIVISMVSILLMFLYFYRIPRHYLIVTISFLGTVIFFVFWIFLFNIKINILNFIALPLTFGIGVDYTSNIIQYFFAQTDAEPIPQKLKRSLKLTAPFVFMSSLTTMIGFASLCLSTNQMAIYSFGLLSFIGEVVSLCGAFVILPYICLSLMRPKVGTF
jgi:predicted RND superfamily exporter protein